MVVASVVSLTFGIDAVQARDRAEAAEADAKARARELEQAYVVAERLWSARDVQRWGVIEHELLKVKATELTPADNARVAVLHAVTQFRIGQPYEAAESFKSALTTLPDAWHDHGAVDLIDLIALEVATLGVHALVRSGQIASGQEAREMIEHVIDAWRAIDDKYPDDYNRFGILLAAEPLIALGEDDAAEPLLRESEQHLGDTRRYPEWHARSLDALAGLLERSGRGAEARVLRERRQQRQTDAGREGQMRPAPMAREAAQDAAKLIAEGTPVEAIEALRRSLDAWHSAWDDHRVADLETLRNVTDSAGAIATAAPESERSQVADMVKLVVESWVGLRGRYPADFAHLGLISAGEALMAIQEDAEARRLLEQAEGVLDAGPRYKDWHRKSVELLAEVTRRLGDHEAATEWARKLRTLPSPNGKQPR